MSSNNNNQSGNNFCTSQLGTTIERFIWTIDNFSERQEKCGECLRSSEFITTTPKSQLLKWQVRIYPNGYEEKSKDYVSIFLSLFLDKRNKTNEEVKAKYRFSIRKSNGDEFKPNIGCGGDVIFRGDVSFGKSFQHSYYNWTLIKREDLLNEENGYLDGDRLTIVCTLAVSVNKAPLPDVKVPDCRGMEDMSNLFETGQFSDCKITSEDDKEFKVHKNILWCRSPVFKAIFEHKMTENTENVVDIVDIKGAVIEQMLRYIYTGKEPADWGNMAEDLLIAADKYELTRLKLICEHKLVDSLKIANACELLSLANLYSAKHLKVHAIDFIEMNLTEVMKSDGWKTYADEQLKEQILKTIAKCKLNED